VQEIPTVYATQIVKRIIVIVLTLVFIGITVFIISLIPTVIGGGSFMGWYLMVISIIMDLVYLGLVYSMFRKIRVTEAYLQIGPKKISWENILGVQDRRTKAHYRAAHVIPVGAYEIEDIVIFFKDPPSDKTHKRTISLKNYNNRQELSRRIYDTINEHNNFD
jgi:cbb3-type cytochrome oxidase subunit 3